MSEYGWKYLTRDDKETILRGIEDGVAHGGPYHVEVHPADRCNIDCFFCSTAAIRGKDEIPMPRFVELLGELKEAGTRSLRLSGGGEPLFHRNIRDFLRAVRTSGLPIENLTTNGVLLRSEVAELLVDTCDLVSVSLNTGDEASYAAMMQTSPRNFQRVVDNTRELIALRRRRGAAGPAVTLQFLVWKENFRSIPAMYRLAKEIGVDRILFNGLSYLQPHQKMTEAETDEMMALYEEVVRSDSYRTVGAIHSFEQDLSGRVEAMNQRLRAGLSLPRKAARLSQEKLRQKLVRAASRGMESYCLIGWHSLLIRTTGEVAPCCILQGKSLGNVYRQPLHEVWHGEAYRQFRAEISRIFREGPEWRHDPESDRTVDHLCGAAGGCPIATFYYRPDVRFLRSYNESLRQRRA